MKPHFHGSDLELIEKYYHIPKDEIISFSANVNPLGSSPLMKERLRERIDCVEEYPDRDYSALRASIASYLSCGSEHILPGNGSTELISLFIRLLSPKKAILISPTYFEYERELSLKRCVYEYFNLREEDSFVLDMESLFSVLNRSTDSLLDCDMLIMCNPNNPTSSCVRTDEMRNILTHCKRNNISVMVDETYAEFADGSVSSIPLANEFDNLVVLRGTSKFFACPGLRLGYAVCGSSELLARAKALQNPWSLNSLGALAGEIMFKDTEYIKKTRALISNERDRIYKILKGIPFIKVYEPHANFLLFKLLNSDVNSHQLFEKAIKKKLMIRDCSEFESLDETYIRFCFMNPEQNDLLLRVLFDRSFT